MKNELPPLQTALKAGSLSMIYENGAIRYIRYGGDEIIRMIYVALRDKNWGTYTPLIENEQIDVYENSFSIHYRCRHEENNKTIFNWEISIDGDENGRISFAIRGKAVTALWKNRAGFCILHPINNTAGEPLTVIHSDDSKEEGFFPFYIAPVNPFSYIKGLQWKNNGNGYALEMEGEAFEMEDQRNWTDASFKTFCTPLDLPFPVLMKEGEEVNQRIRFYAEKALPALPETGSGNLELVIPDRGQRLPFPVAGLGASTEIVRLSAQSAAAIKKLNADYYHIEVSPSVEGWKEALSAQVQQAAQLSLPVFISIALGDQYRQEFAVFTELTAAHRNMIRYILITGEPVTAQPVVDWAEQEIKPLFPGALLGIGTAANFAEFNRNTRSLKQTDFLSYSIHPQAHAVDNISLIENAAAQADTLISTNHLYPGKAVFVTPVTLRARLNPYAHNKAESIISNDRKADPRQASLWNAGWTLASFKYLAENGAKGITYFQTAGRQGVCNEEGDSYPAGVLLERLLNLKEAGLIKTTLNEPLQCSSLLLEDDKKHLFLANHTGHAIRIRLPFAFSVMESIQPFPSSTIKTTIKSGDVVELPAYAVAELS